jgi:hypothetical protein
MGHIIKRPHPAERRVARLPEIWRVAHISIYIYDQVWVPQVSILRPGNVLLHLGP